MARSSGVIFSVVVVFIGSGLTILFAGLMAIGVMVILHSHRPGLGVAVAVAGIEGLMVLAFAVWGIVTGVGLIGLRAWARISLLIFSGLLAATSAFAAIVLALIPFPTAVPPDSSASLPANFFVMIRIGMVAFYGVLALLGGFWLWYFNTRSVKEQFGGRIATPTGLPDSFPAGVVPPGGAPSRRPVSVTIIGWFLAICPVLTLPSIAMWYVMGIWRQLPFYFLGTFLSGWVAAVAFFAWMAATAAAGVGVLKLKNWGRQLAIGLQVVGLLNGALLLGIPAHRARFQQIMSAAANLMVTSMTGSGAPAIQLSTMPAWPGIAVSAPVLLVILYFLVTRKRAFLPPEQHAPPVA